MNKISLLVSFFFFSFTIGHLKASPDTYFGMGVNYITNKVSSLVTSQEERYEKGTYPEISYAKLVTLFQKTWFPSLKEEQLKLRELKSYNYNHFPPYHYEYSSSGEKHSNSFVLTDISYGSLSISHTNIGKFGSIIRLHPNEQKEETFKAYIEALISAKTKSDMNNFIPTYSNDETNHFTPYTFLDLLKKYIPENGGHEANLLLDIQFCEHASGCSHTYTKLVLRLLVFNKDENHPLHFSLTGYRVRESLAQDAIPDLISKLKGRN